LASHLLFPEAKVSGVDNDPDTIGVAEENRDFNRIPKSKVSFTGDNLEKLSPGYDLILANLTLGPILELAPEIKRLSKEGTYLILSGVIESQAEETSQRFGKEGFKTLTHLGQEEWSSLRLIKVKHGEKRPGPLPRRVVLAEASLETKFQKEA
jgi:ribosomal protein L11 methyltransferase